MSSYKISARAYTKMILHAVKYPHCAINGILLSSEESPKDIVDVVTLFHQCLHLSPMAEIALVQIEAMASEKGLEIAGYYAACELFDDNTIDKAPAPKIADKIAENNPNACFVVIDNTILIDKESGPALNLWHYVNGNWSPTKFTLEKSSDTLDAVHLLVKRGAAKDIFDFDNHLDNVKIDWHNKHLNRDIEQLLAMYE